MTRKIAFPFLTLPDEAVTFGGWMIGNPDHPLAPAGSVLDNWDYARDLEVGSSVEIDWDLASAAIKVDKDVLKLRLALVVGTGTGTLPRRQDRVRELVVEAGSGELRLFGILDGACLSGRLRLSLRILLESPCAGGDSLSPTRPGARLWETDHDVLIEDGGDSRFPVETVSFSEVFRGKSYERAPWFLHWHPDALQSDFSASVRLYVNADRPVVLDRFVRADGVLLQAIMGDVASQITEVVLDRDDAADALARCDEGSVGRQVLKWLVLGFPGQEITSIRTLRNKSPGMFRAGILAASEMEISET